jgi:hypothetical protein
MKAVANKCFQAGFLLGLFFDPEDRSDMFLRNIGLHGVISQKTELFSIRIVECTVFYAVRVVSKESCHILY